MERIRIRRKTTVKLLLLPFFGQKHHVPTLQANVLKWNLSVIHVEMVSNLTWEYPLIYQLD